MVFSKINNLSVPKRILNFLSIPKSWRKDLRSYIFTLILGGGLGNLYDRIVNHAVVDFIDFHINGFHWFIFNVADIFISLGVICLIFVELFLNKKTKNTLALFEMSNGTQSLERLSRQTILWVCHCLVTPNSGSRP